MAKKPELLILDEPIASLDPLARREFLDSLAEFAAVHQVGVVMSSHLVGDLERVCNYLIVLVASQVQLAGEVGELLASHRQHTGAPASGGSAAATSPEEWLVTVGFPGGGAGHGPPSRV